MIPPTPFLGGRYRLTSRIATGGMGEVWRADDELLGREVAVKLLRRHVAGQPEFRERFRAEARITAGLTDGRIAQVFDYGEGDDTAYLVMELVPGEPLSAILIRNESLGPEVTLDVIAQAALGLQAAHQAGIIHRDVKPGNLLITRHGLVKITDFGIARALEAASLTQTGTVLGTAQYVSPEQASGLPLTPATDIYSLGVVAYECLAGMPPFVAETTVAVALRHLNDVPEPLPETVPAEVRGLVMAMLAKDPAQRPASAREVSERARELRESLAGAGTVELSMLTDPVGFPQQPPAHTGPPTAVEPVAPHPVRRNRRKTTVLFATAGCVAAVGLGAVAVIVAQNPADRQTIGESATPSPVPTSPGKSKSPTPKPPRRVLPVTSARPTVSPSATVSTSAPSTTEPTATPSSTPTATPTTTPAPEPSDTQIPEESPTGTDLSNAET